MFHVVSGLWKSLHYGLPQAAPVIFYRCNSPAADLPHGTIDGGVDLVLAPPVRTGYGQRHRVRREP